MKIGKPWENTITVEPHQEPHILHDLENTIKTSFNPFLFGDADMEAAQQANARVELMLSGGASPLLADADDLISLEG